ncbi:MAG: carbohydrate kinase [Clostridiales bacterium]|nr:carbohydrate kinase [Clostridiales bacterium]
MTTERIIELMSRTASSRITVIGDFCLDKYLYIDPALDEPSIETGLTAYQVTGKGLYPGGAGNVAKNLRALKAQVTCIGVIGNDGEGWELVNALNNEGADTRFMIRDPQRCTSTYTKPMRLNAEGKYDEMNRLDFKNFRPMSAQTEKAVIEALYEAAKNSDAIIVLDQFIEENCGVINANVRAAVTELASQYPDLIIYGDSRAYIHLFSSTMVKCNNFEVVRCIIPDYEGEPDEATVDECAKKLYEKNNREVFVTMGSEGIMVYSKNGKALVKTIKVAPPIDICGAGDSATSGIVLGLTLGATPEEAALIGNMVASITIQQIGVTGSATPEQVVNRYKEKFE